MITIENINGVPHTVIWYREYVTASHINKESGTYAWAELKPFGSALFVNEGVNVHAAIALAPMPRYPAKDDAALLYAYASHGIFVGTEYAEILSPENIMYRIKSSPLVVVITHAVNAQGERVDVAIEGDL
jgi:hypothetical protein